MKIKNFKQLVLIIISLTLFTGCLLNTRENLDRLTDRKFYFTEFQYVLQDQNKESAFKLYQGFPVKKIMFMIAKEYNLTIDISEYEKFINRKDISVIDNVGLFRTVKNIWKTPNQYNNRIKFIFERDYFDDTKLNFKIEICSGESTLKTINSDISKIEYIFKQLDFHLTTGKESKKEYQDNNYDNVSPIPSIIEAGIEKSTVEEPVDLIKIKTIIDNYVKSLNPEEKNKFKHDIIDYIYQKCN